MTLQCGINQLITATWVLDYEDIWDDPVYQDENLEENQDVKERRFGASISVLILITFPLNI